MVAGDDCECEHTGKTLLASIHCPELNFWSCIVTETIFLYENGSTKSPCDLPAPDTKLNTYPTKL